MIESSTDTSSSEDEETSLLKNNKRDSILSYGGDSTDGSESRRQSASSANTLRSCNVVSRKPSAVSASSTHDPRFRLSSMLEEEACIIREDVNLDKDHNTLLHIYMFVARCIAYDNCIAFKNTSVQSIPPKVNQEGYKKICEDFVDYFSVGGDSVLGDYVFALNKKYYTEFLCDPRIARIVRANGISFHILCNIYESFLSEFIQRGCITEDEKTFILDNFTLRCQTSGNRIEHTRELHKLSKDKLYEMFQKILSINQNEALTVYNAARLDNEDEQLACLKRELNIQADNLASKCAKLEFVHKAMPEVYIEESKDRFKSMGTERINNTILKINKSGSDGKFMDEAAHKIGVIKKRLSFGGDNSNLFIKVFGDCSYNIRLTVHDIKGMESLGDHDIFVVMHLGGHPEEDCRTQNCPAKEAKFQIAGTWTVPYPLTHLKLTVMGVRTSRLKLEHETALTECTINIHAGTCIRNKWFTLKPFLHRRHSFIKSKWHFDEAKIKLSYEMNGHKSIKRAGFLECEGQSHWRTLKERFFMVVKLLDNDMALCTYVSNALVPKHFIMLSNYAVDFANTDALEDKTEGRFYFKLQSKGERMVFSSASENDQLNWIKVLYLATGQSVKPYGVDDWNSISLNNAEQKRKREVEAEAFKKGLSNVIGADPGEFNQKQLFSILQKLTLSYQLKEQALMGRLTRNQKYVLRGYRQRYDIHVIFAKLDTLKHLICLSSDEQYTVDPRYVRSVFRFLSLEMSGRGSIKYGYTKEENQEFLDLHAPLYDYVRRSIIYFREMFPFNQPKLRNDDDNVESFGEEKGFLSHHLELLQEIFANSPHHSMLRLGSKEERNEQFHQNLQILLRETIIHTYNKITDHLKDILESNKEPFQGKIEATIICVDKCSRIIDELKTYFIDIPYHFTDIYQTHLAEVLSYDIEWLLRMESKYSWESLLLYDKLHYFIKSNDVLRRNGFDVRMEHLFAPIALRNIQFMEDELEGDLQRLDVLTPKRSDEFYFSVTHHLETSFRRFIEYINTMTRMWSPSLVHHLEHRLRCYAANVMEEFCNRMYEDYMDWFQPKKMKKKSVVPQKCLKLIAVLYETKEWLEELGLFKEPQQDQKHFYQVELREFMSRKCDQMIQEISNNSIRILTPVLWRISLLDVGGLPAKLLGKIFSKQDLAKPYFDLMTENYSEIRQCVGHYNEAIYLMEKACWYDICKHIYDWLENHSDTELLHPEQISVIKNLTQGAKGILSFLSEEEISFELYQKVEQRMRIQTVLQDEEFGGEEQGLFSFV